jgi:hypothetical protein
VLLIARVDGNENPVVPEVAALGGAEKEKVMTSPAAY